VLSLPVFLAFNDVALRVIGVAWWALGILILALIAAAVNRALVAIARGEDVVLEATLELDRAQTLRFYEDYHRAGPKNVATAWMLTLVLGPVGAFGYMRQWGKCAVAFFTLNGLGAWWLESLFSVPQLVLIENRRLARQTIEQMNFLAESAVRAHE
jgi:hypothetical protein